MAVASKLARSHDVDLRAEPSSWQRADDQRNGIPVRAKGRNVVPCRDRACRREKGPDSAANQRVHHGSIGREPRGDVAADDSISRPIDRRPQEHRARGVFTKRRIKMHFVENRVCDECDRDHNNEANEDAKGTAANGAFR